MEIKAIFVERISKAGTPYKVIELHLAPNYIKRVFLDTAELMLLQNYLQDKK